jgi:hypothetical protein
MEVQRLVELIGNKKEIAAALNLSFQTVYGWGKTVPPRQMAMVIIALERQSALAAKRSKDLAQAAKDLREQLARE